MRQTVTSWTSHLNKYRGKGQGGNIVAHFPYLLLLYHLLGICSFDLRLRCRSKQILLTVQSVSKPAYSLLIQCWSLRQWWLYFDAIMVSESWRPKGGGEIYIYIYILYIYIIHILYIYIYIKYTYIIFSEKKFFLENYQIHALFHFCIFKIKLLPVSSN